MASRFWLLCIWHKPQWVTKQQKPYYSSTLHCLLSAITSRLMAFDLYVTDTNLKRGSPHFPHTFIVSSFYHSLFSLKWKSRHAIDSISPPQLGFAGVSNRPHLFPEKSETENIRYHNTVIWTVWEYVHVCAWKWKCVQYITVCIALCVFALYW